MRFGILGPLEVRENGNELKLGAGRQRALLTLLLLHANEVVSTERLIDALWGERAPATAVKVVQGYVSQLRKVLSEDVLVTRAGGYVLRATETDVAEFERLVDEARSQEPAEAARTLRQALVLWRGRPLSDVEYETWAQTEIERLEELRLAAVEDRIDAELHLGRHAQLVPELEALVRASPFRERSRGQLMLALYRSGRQAEALESYRDGRRVLVEELGIEPGPALKELEQAILTQDAAIAGVPTGRASSPLRHGRARALIAVGAGLILFAVGAVVFAATRSDEAGGFAVVAANSVGIIDPATNRLVDQVPVGATPTQIDVGEGSVWVTNADDRTVSQINAASRTLVRTFAVETTPTDVVAAFGAVWVGGRDPPEVRRLDPRSGVVTQRIAFSRPPREGALGAFASGVKLTTGGGSLWASAAGVPQDELLARIDPRAGRIIATLRPVYAGPLAAGAGSIWMSQFGTLTRVDVVANEATRRTFDPPRFAGPIAADDTFVWWADEFEDTLWQLDVSSLRLLRSIQVGMGPGGVALGFGSVWVASADGTVSRIDPASHRVVATIRVGGVPHGIAVGAGSVWVTVG